MTLENTTTTVKPLTFTAEQYAELRASLRTSLIEIPDRPVPPHIAQGDSAEWVEWVTSEEPLGDLLERYKALPSPQHLNAALSIGLIGAGRNTSRLMSHYADHYEQHKDQLTGHGLTNIKIIIDSRSWTARLLPVGLPPIEVCRTLWTLDPDSPTGLASVRTGKALKGEPRAAGAVIVYRPPTGEKFSYDPADLVAILEDDTEGNELNYFERAELARLEQLREERENMTTITPAELTAINEEFPPLSRQAFIALRMYYNSKFCDLRQWDAATRRVSYDVPALLADMRSRTGARTVERFERLAEQGIDLAGVLCAQLTIPLTRGSLMYQTAKQRGED